MTDKRFNTGNRASLEKVLRTALNVFSSFSYLLFVSSILLYTLIHIFLTSQFSREATRRFPYIVLSALLILILVEFIRHLSSMSYSIDSTVEPSEYVNKILQGTWPFIYLVGFFYIGVFTTTFVCTVIYVVAHSSADMSTRVRNGTITATLMTVITYIIFIVVFDSYIFLELGFLP